MKRTGRQKDIVTPEKKQEQRELLRLFSANIRKILKNTDLLADDLQEIRLRTGAPLLVVAKDQEYFLTPDGALTGEWEKGYPVSPTDIRDTMDYIGSFSLYAYEDELRQGFLTVEGGHRIGIAGKTVIEGEKVKGISHISCINVRVAHEKKGCADRVMPYLWEDGRFLHTLIVSAPGCGKTTMLRDIIRQISDPAALCFDFEVYSEAQKRWLEVSSVSNFDTYQANRLKCRYRTAEKKTELCHTLNGSALALPRIVAALLENNQTPEGIRIPKALVPYTGFEIID